MTLGKKGQGIAIDFLFAVLVFLLVLNACMSIFDNNAISVFEKNLLNGLHSATNQSVDMLVRTTGQPQDWQKKNIDDVQVIGLAKRDRVLDSSKVEKFAEWAENYSSSDYNRCKSLLLMGYDYSLKILDSSGATLYQAPAAYPSSWDLAVNLAVKRIVNIDGDEAVVEFTTYYPAR